MASKVHPIAKITRVSGLKGEVRLQPLSRYFDEYVESRDLSIGFDSEIVREIQLSRSIGKGKSKRFLFKGIASRNDAETLIGQTLFASGREGDAADLISKDLIGFNVITESGNVVGTLTDILWLPSNDVYVIRQGEDEKLIPIVKEIVIGIDFQMGIIIIAPMEGLL